MTTNCLNVIDTRRITALLLAIAFLGLPMTSHLLDSVLGASGMPSSSGIVWGLKAALALLGVGVSILAYKRLPDRNDAHFSPQTPVNMMLFTVFVAALFQTHFNSQAAAFDKEAKFTLSFRVGGWGGRDNALSDETAAEIGRDRITTRRYTNHTNAPIDILITMTGRDRRTAHPPEACMTGTGWKIQSRCLKDLTAEDKPPSSQPNINRVSSDDPIGDAATVHQHQKLFERGR